LRAFKDDHGAPSGCVETLVIIVMASRTPFSVHPLFSFFNHALVISVAILGKVGNDEAVILTWSVHDPFEDLLVSLSLMRG
jgi:hypothetical protein